MDYYHYTKDGKLKYCAWTIGAGDVLFGGPEYNPNDCTYEHPSFSRCGCIIFSGHSTKGGVWAGISSKIERQWLANNRRRFTQLDSEDPPTEPQPTIEWQWAVSFEEARGNPNRKFSIKMSQKYLCRAAKKATLAGDTAALRLLADTMDVAKAFVAYKSSTENTYNVLYTAIREVVQKHGRVPTQDEVWEAVPEQILKSRRGFDKALIRMGFSWLPRKASDLNDWLEFVQAQGLWPTVRNKVP